MKYLTFIRHSEKYRESPPPAALMEAMGQVCGEVAEGRHPRRHGRPLAEQGRRSHEASEQQDHRDRRSVQRE